MPEIASRAHVERILPVIDETLRRAGVARPTSSTPWPWPTRPGLAGSLLVGLAAAKALALGWGVPLVAVNHLQAHIYACRLAAGEEVFPCVGLIVSGGHTSLYRCRTPLDFELLGGTIDDAAGEAFDKVASLLGLAFPGGPAIERAARDGDPPGLRSCRARCSRTTTTLDFSFSGLKTAVRYRVAGAGRSLPATAAVGPPDCVADLAAAFKRRWSIAWWARRCWPSTGPAWARSASAAAWRPTRCCASGWPGGTGARGVRLFIPPLRLCTDNAVMGAIALERLKAGLVERLDIDITPGLVRR